MATGLDGLLFTLTTTLIVARILAFPTQIDLPDNEYMVEDLGLYSGTKPKPSCYDFSLDLIGKIQFAQYQLSDDVDKRWYSSIGRSIHLM
jgi:hypothetical protein